MPTKRHADIPGALVSFLTLVFLVVCLVSSGFLACIALPRLTEELSTRYSHWESSPYAPGEIVETAAAVFEYSIVENNREKLDEALAKLFENRGNGAEGEKTEGELSGEVPDEDDPIDEGTTIENAPDTHTLTPDAINHLDDVYRVVSAAKIALIACVGLALLGLVFCGIHVGRRRVGGLLLASASLVIVGFIALAVWMILDFNRFFAAFHSLFFTEGTWQFSSTSLLITLYPTEFWVGMGVVWLAASVACCLVFMILGFILRIGAKRKRLL